MIIVRLQGGLGNQMFQYALGRSLAIKNKDKLKLDINSYNPSKISQRDYQLNNFNIQADVIPRDKNFYLSRLIYKVSKLFKSKGLEKNYNFDKEILDLKGDVILDGFWQSYKYFNEYNEIIKKDFTLNHLSDKVLKLIHEIKEKNSVCLHIRRGDYVGNSFHPVKDFSYYENGLKEIEKKGKIDCVYVFDRDDIEWCKKNLKFNYPTVFVDADINSDISVAETLIIMSTCKHFVLANSSFSWWGAWLSNNPSKLVICPKQWFGDSTIDTSDLIPPEWIRI